MLTVGIVIAALAAFLTARRLRRSQIRADKARLERAALP